jgi:hypothetical protein
MPIPVESGVKSRLLTFSFSFLFVEYVFETSSYYCFAGSLWKLCTRHRGENPSKFFGSQKRFRKFIQSHIDLLPS